MYPFFLIPTQPPLLLLALRTLLSWAGDLSTSWREADSQMALCGDFLLQSAVTEF